MPFSWVTLRAVDRGLNARLVPTDGAGRAPEAAAAEGRYLAHPSRLRSKSKSRRFRPSGDAARMPSRSPPANVGAFMRKTGRRLQAVSSRRSRPSSTSRTYDLAAGLWMVLNRHGSLGRFLSLEENEVTGAGVDHEPHRLVFDLDRDDQQR